MTEYLYDALVRYTGADQSEDERHREEVYPLHMPGHKRRVGSMCDPYCIDITEIDGFDNLHHAEGILKEAQERAAGLYESEETHFLVNGSTGGILAAVSGAMAAGRRKGKNGILMARNCHKAAYHAVYICDADPVWLYPRPFADDRQRKDREPNAEMSEGRKTGDPETCLGGRIDPEDVENALQAHPECGAVMIVSPTYDGMISDVARIARIVHRHGAVLIVDEAHGAHYGLHPRLPRSSVQQGADLVIHSLHKTLPALTQTALLHINGPYVDREFVRRYLQIYQTSSPSYVLMASMDQCIRWLETHAGDWFTDYADMLERFYESVRDLRMLRVVRPDDPSKILIFPGKDAGAQLSGNRICDILRANYSLEPEMAVPAYVLALISVSDDEEGLAKLSDALHEIDQTYDLYRQFGREDILSRYQMDLRDQTGIVKPADAGLPDAGQQDLPAVYAAVMSERPNRVMSIRSAWDGERTAVPVELSAGRTAGEPVYLYPPGIPIVVPGEEISQTQAEWMAGCLAAGFELHGMEDPNGRQIQVVVSDKLETYNGG